MKNTKGISKIEKWLNANGYHIVSYGTEMYRHNDSFHKGMLYYLDIYGISNSYYIKVKPEGKPRYYLCEKNDGLNSVKRIAFSQDQFISFTKDIFPTLKEK